MALRVRKIATGEIGTLQNDSDFDPNRYELLERPQTQAPVESEAPIAEQLSQGGLLSQILGGVVSPAEKVARTTGGALAGLGLSIPALLGNKQAQETVLRGDIPLLTKRQEELFRKGSQMDIAKEGIQQGARAAQYLIPGGKGWNAVKTGAARGVSGALGESGGKSGAEVGADILTGAATGGIAEGILSNILGAGKSVEKAGEGLRKGVLKPNVPSGPKSIVEEDKLLKKAGELGLKGTPKSQRIQVAQTYDDISNSINKVLKKSNNKADLDVVKGTIKQRLAEQGDFFVPGDTTFDRILNRELSLLDKKAVNGKLTAKQLFDFKNDLSKNLGNFFRKQSGDLQSAVTNVEGVRGDVWRVVDDVLTQVEPSVKELTTQQSLLHRLAPGLEKASKETVKLPIIGTEVSAAPFQGLQDILGRGAQKVGGIGSRVGGAIPGQAVTGATVGAVQGAIPQAMPTTATTDDGTTTSPVQEGTQDQNNELEQVVTLLKLVDPKNADVYESLISIGGAGTPEQTTAARSVGQLKDIYSKVQQQGLTATQPGLLGRALGGAKGTAAAISQRSPEAAVYKSTREAFLSSISRGAGEKGTLTDKDIDRVKNALPDFADIPEVAAGKWKQLEGLLGELKDKYPDNPALSQ